MSKLDCHIVQDLLPLYIDGDCSRETAADLGAHLADCAACRELHREMSRDLGPAFQTPEFDSGSLLRRVGKIALGVILTLTVMLVCFFINAGAAWLGGPGDGFHFTATLLYVLFWGVFCLLSRNTRPLLRLSLTLGLITCFSAAVGLIARLAGGAGFLTALLAIFAAIPFYGLRLFLDWTGLYAAALSLSLVWLLYTWRAMKRLALLCKP